MGAPDRRTRSVALTLGRRGADHIATDFVPHYISSVHVEERGLDVFVTWELGEPVPGGAEFFTYGVTVVSEADVVKRFALRHSPDRGWTGYVFDHGSTTQGNYAADAVPPTTEFVAALFADASLGTDNVSSITGWLNVNGDDTQSGIDVVLLRR